MQRHRRRDAGASTTTNDQEIARNPHPPKGLGAGRAYLFVAPPRRCLDIDSSSRLDLVSVPLPTYVIVFMKVSTSSGLTPHSPYRTPKLLTLIDVNYYN